MRYWLWEVLRGVTVNKVCFRFSTNMDDSVERLGGGLLSSQNRLAISPMQFRKWMITRWRVHNQKYRVPILKVKTIELKKHIGRRS